MDKNNANVVEKIKAQAEAGDAACQYNLGQMYAFGHGSIIAVDESQAVHWWSKAAQGGIIQANLNLGVHYRKQGDDKTAFAWYMKGAELGQRECEKNIGYMFYTGAGTKKDFEQAFYWYKKAADKGNPDAILNLAQMYEEGEGTAVNLEQARRLYEQNSVENDDRESQLLLAAMCALGKGGPQDLDAAFKWARKADEKDHRGAPMLLVYLSQITGRPVMESEAYT